MPNINIHMNINLSLFNYNTNMFLNHVQDFILNKLMIYIVDNSCF